MIKKYIFLAIIVFVSCNEEKEKLAGVYTKTAGGRPNTEVTLQFDQNMVYVKSSYNNGIYRYTYEMDPETGNFMIFTGQDSLQFYTVNDRFYFVDNYRVDSYGYTTADTLVYKRYEGDSLINLIEAYVE